MTTLWPRIEPLLARVEKPARYIGMESGRNYLYGPGVNEWQMAVQRNFRVTEKAKLQLRLEGVRNVFNHTQFFKPDANITNGPSFGRVTRAIDPKLFQLALRLSF